MLVPRFAGAMRALLCLIILLIPGVVQAQSLLAHGNGDDLWIVRVSKDKDGNPQAVVRARLGAAARWSVLGTFPAQPVVLTSRGREYVVLFSNGDWFLGSSLGRRLPAGGKIITLAGNASTLYALGSVPGGMGAISASTQPTTRAASGPATAPATTSASVTTAPSARLVLFQLNLSTWTPLVELPAELMDRPVSLAVVEGRPWLAVAAADGQLRILKLTESNELVEPAPFPTAFDARTFKLIEARSAPVLWSAGETGAGSVHFMTGESWSTPVELSVGGDLSQPTDRTIAAASERFRFYFIHDDKVSEQQFTLQGEPTGKLTSLAEPVNPNQPRPNSILQLVFMMVLTFILFSTVRRRTEVTTETELTLHESKLAIAPLIPRFMAGLVDVVPVFVGLYFFGMKLEENPELSLWSTDAFPLWIGLSIYFVHTLTAELLVRRTVGKMIFGLQVVTLLGTPPRPVAIVIRNLVRLIEVFTVLPLILLVYSPLRQRIGDTIAQTLVVVRKTDQDPDEGEDSDPV